jgi:ankyrin repeat protein
MSKSQESKELIKIFSEFREKLNNAKIQIGEEWPQVLGKELIKAIGELRFFDTNSEEGQRALVFAKILIESKVDFTVSIDKGYTALSMASMVGSIELVNLLIEQGVNVNQENLANTPLMASCLVGNYRMTKFLIEKGANIHLKNMEGHQAIDFSVALTVNRAVIKLLLEEGAKITQPLTSARLFESFSKDLQMFKLLVKQGMKFYDQKIANQKLDFYLKKVDPEENKTKEYLKLFIKMRSAFNTKGEANEWLKYYFNKDDVEMVGYILSAKCLAKTTEVKTYSFDKGGKEVTLTRVVGAEVNLVIDENNNTMLHKAIKNNNPNMVSMLLQFGANYDAKNSEGKTSFSLAKDLESNAIAKILDYQLFRDLHNTDSDYITSLIENNVRHMAWPNENNIEVKTSGDWDHE